MSKELTLKDFTRIPTLFPNLEITISYLSLFENGYEITIEPLLFNQLQVKIFKIGVGDDCFTIKTFKCSEHLNNITEALKVASEYYQEFIAENTFTG